MSHTFWLVVLLGTAGLALGQVRQGAWTPVEESMERGYTSISYWTNRDDGVEIGGGRISIEHGKPRWPAALDDEAAFDAATLGKLWRFGNNKWTTLDTQLALRFSERELAPGIYYLVLQRVQGESWRLGFVDPEAVRPALIDAWAVQARPAEIPMLFTVPLSHALAEKTSELDVTLGLDASDETRGSLVIGWGPHRLRTAFRIDVPSPTFYRLRSEP